jgi:hypothetical protein
MHESSVVMAAHGPISDDRERGHQAERRLSVWTDLIRSRIDPAVERQELALPDECPDRRGAESGLAELGRRHNTSQP